MPDRNDDALRIAREREAVAAASAASAQRAQQANDDAEWVRRTAKMFTDAKKLADELHAAGLPGVEVVKHWEKGLLGRHKVVELAGWTILSIPSTDMSEDTKHYLLADGRVQRHGAAPYEQASVPRLNHQVLAWFEEGLAGLRRRLLP